ncbi:MAG TPA: DMT family transporter [Thermoplasmata archaeon]|nr:DMT family transporter [Thermoplasmata archaeon]
MFGPSRSAYPEPRTGERCVRPARAVEGKPLAATANSASNTIRLSSTDVALIVLLGLIWGSAFPAIRFGLLAGASPIAFGVARFAGATAVMVPIALLRRTDAPDRTTILYSAVLGGVLLIGLYAAFLYIGEEVISAGLASVLVGCSPIWSALFGIALLPSDRLSRRAWAGLLLGFVGVIVLFLPDLLHGAGGSTWGAVAVLLAAVVAALGSVLLRRMMHAPPNAWSLSVEFSMAALLLGVLSVSIPGQAALPLRWEVWVSLAYLVAIPSIAGYTIYFRLLHTVGPSRSNLVTYVAPLAGIGIGVLLLGEAPSATELFGFVLIVLGLLFVQREPARPTGDSGPLPAGTSPASTGSAVSK